MERFERLSLIGPVVHLMPLLLEHVDALWEAANESRATYEFSSVPDSHEAMRAYVENAIGEWERGEGLTFAISHVDTKKIVGSTRFARAERWVWPTTPKDGFTRSRIDGVEIGFTWLAESAQRSRVNTDSKRLMLEHAFEALDIRRVIIKTDERNLRSRAAIERIGGKLDGVLRANMPSNRDGIVRNSAVYSILKSEWPAVREGLEEKLRER